MYHSMQIVFSIYKQQKLGAETWSFYIFLFPQHMIEGVCP